MNFESSGCSSRHFCSLPHRAFNPQCDEHLYINLDCMNPSTPMVTFDDKFKCCVAQGVPVPLFIAGPLMVLRTIYEGGQNCDTESFFNCLDYTTIYDPTPENPQCTVCDLVQWLLKKCCSLQECMGRLYNQNQMIMFEVMREIFVRLRPKPLPISPRHIEIAKRFNYIGLPFHNFLLSPMTPHIAESGVNWNTQLAGSLEWTNGFMYLLYLDIGERGMQSNVARFIFVNLIRILRRYSGIAFPPQCCPSLAQFYMLEAVRCHQSVALQPIMKLARALSLALLEYEPFGFVCDTPPLPGYRKEEIYAYRHNMQRVMENILMMNVTDIFYNSPNLNGAIRHTREQHSMPNTCACRFAQSLEEEDCQCNNF
ncbi:hypothetical protein TcWFU_009153 [Taenia crassiceps]|uniref:Uncharacterized protein n=1 Tax=Taenia crassiceps TaxID=6207 RepID=A0ABR4QCP2_9CEST